jgi:uncharacterized protein (TIGR02246 family)
MRKTVAVLALGSLLGVGTIALAADPAKTYTGVAPAPSTAGEREIAGLFDRWNAALATGKPAEVARLYASNAVLAPTVSNEVRDTPEKIEDYFTHFLQLKPQGTVNYRQIRVLDENTALDAGVYTFAVTQNGAPAKVQARYTYLYEKVNGEWKIMNHHSSAMPEPVDQSKL